MITLKPTGTVEFRMYLPRAGRVQILGDFTTWGAAPIEMLHDGDGWWIAEAEILEGDHTFRYLVDGHQWVTDFAAHGVSMNDYGTWNSGLIVPAVPAAVEAERRAA